MRQTINSLTDARRIISDWTTGYLQPITDEQRDRAARALVDHLGGYGRSTEDEDDATSSTIDHCADFDLDAALYGEGR